MEKRIGELDVLRVFAMLLVITFHYAAVYETLGISHFNFLCQTPNYDFGNVAVTIFFILSGGLLYKKYGCIAKGSLKKFYIKRIKSIYPPFFILNLYIPIAMVRHWISDGNPFFAGHPAKLLLTLVGMDGYIQEFGVSTYFFCGEWFIGAIIILYVLYPLLAKLYKRFSLAMVLILVTLYASQFFFLGESIYMINIMPLTIILKFCLGFVLVEHLERFRKKIIPIVCFFILFFLTFVDVPGILNVDCFGFIASLCFFFVVFWGTPKLLKFNSGSELVKKLASLSYCVFLVHHVAISWCQMAYAIIFEKFQWHFSQWNVFALFFVTFTVILISAGSLKWVSDKLVKKWA